MKTQPHLVAIRGIAHLLRFQRKELVALLNVYGSSVTVDSKNATIIATVLAYLPKKKFRDQLKALFKKMDEHFHFTASENFMNFSANENYMNFSANENFMNFSANENYMNANGLDSILQSLGTLGGGNTSPSNGGFVGPVQPGSGSSSSSTGLNLKDIFTNDRVGGIFDIGLDFLNDKLKNKDNQATAQKLIELENAKAQNTNYNTGAGSSSSGMPGGNTLKIVVGVVIGIGVIYGIYRLMKK